MARPLQLGRTEATCRIQAIEKGKSMQRKVLTAGGILAMTFLLACGSSGTLTPAAPTANARAAALGATATSIALGNQPVTPDFFPANRPSAVASVAAQP